MNTQLIQARDGATKAGLKLLEVAKEDADAGFAAVRDFLSAKSPIEAFDVSAKYWRGRLETRMAQAQDLGAYARRDEVPCRRREVHRSPPSRPGTPPRAPYRNELSTALEAPT